LWSSLTDASALFERNFLIHLSFGGTFSSPKERVTKNEKSKRILSLESKPTDLETEFLVQRHFDLENLTGQPCAKS
jgi:hypothetical protein